MTHQSESERLTRHFKDDCGGGCEGVLDALANQLFLKAQVGGRVSDDYCLTRLSGGCWDCQELGRRLGILDWNMS